MTLPQVNWSRQEDTLLGLCTESGRERERERATCHCIEWSKTEIMRWQGSKMKQGHWTGSNDSETQRKHPEQQQAKTTIRNVMRARSSTNPESKGPWKGPRKRPREISPKVGLLGGQLLLVTSGAALRLACGKGSPPPGGSARHQFCVIWVWLGS